MKLFKISSLLLFLFIASCTPKSYFNSEIRAKVESKAISVNQLQYYVDKDVELRRELSSGDMKVSSGKVKMEKGKYVHIIYLKKNTPGVCTRVSSNNLEISFETGDNKYLTFGKTKNAQPNDPYRILANDWVSDYGVVNYDGKKYHIQPEGTEAAILIKTKMLKTYSVEERKMKGRTVSDKNSTSGL